MINKFFKDSMIGAVVLTTSLMIGGLFIIIPYLTNEQAKKDAFIEAQRVTTYLKMFRTYYNNDILSKIKKNTKLKVNFDHKKYDKTVPLPATVLHDLSSIFTQGSDLRVQMYSNFPFPNRKDRVLDKFQQDSLAFVAKNPDKTFSREEIVDDKVTYRTSFPDFLTADSCVNCHNTRVDTPKSDWVIGDIRGVIEVDIPLQNSFGSSQNLTYSILLFILANFLILAIYYYLQVQKKNKKLKQDYTHKDKILSEYKRAVDLGAIVSKSDTNGLITYVNDAFIKISGYSKDELIGRPHSCVRHPDSSKELFHELWKKILNKEVWQGDIRNRAKDGSDYFVFATIVPIVDEKEEIVEFIAIRYDTTSLHVAVQKANKAEKTKGRFLANMSHELRTPLNAIIGFSQILQRRDNLDEKASDYVKKIHISGENLLTLVNSILDFSKMDEGEMDFNPSDINIKNIFDEILMMFEVSVKEKNMTIDMFKCDGSKNIYADRQLLKQAIINIISNAIKFSDENGVIKITHTKEKSKDTFSICDNGKGMNEDDLSTLFTPFKQGQSAQDNVAKGTGLGLAITSKIIKELHGGDIWVESEVDKGTCFYISL